MESNNPVTMIKSFSLCSLFLLVLSSSIAQVSEVIKFECADSTGFRGLSVIDDKFFWMSGQHGTVCRSFDGGTSIACMTVPGCEMMDFRSVYGFDQNKVIVANIGSPAKMMLTEDKGTTWNEVYSNDHPDAFIDGIDFWNDQVGIAYGDPIDGKMLLLITLDGGKTWKDLPFDSRPNLEPGEGSFAASGTSIRCYGDGKVHIATAGNVSRLFTSDDLGGFWQQKAVPIIQGEPSTGIFSFDFLNDNQWVFVGGDYNKEDGTTDHIFLTANQGESWIVPKTPTRGYRECVQFISETSIIAVGPNGIDVSNDSGINWKPFSDEKGFHVIRKARTGDLIIIAGAAGKVLRVKK
jgi:photosystem II stability/assembly factor-like uncharacterized protein